MILKMYTFFQHDLINGSIKLLDLITEGKFEVQGYQSIMKIFNRIYKKHGQQRGKFENTSLDHKHLVLQEMIYFSTCAYSLIIVSVIARRSQIECLRMFQMM